MPDEMAEIKRFVCTTTTRELIHFLARTSLVGCIAQWLLPHYRCSEPNPEVWQRPPPPHPLLLLLLIMPRRRVTINKSHNGTTDTPICPRRQRRMNCLCLVGYLLDRPRCPLGRPRGNTIICVNGVSRQWHSVQPRDVSFSSSIYRPGA